MITLAIADINNEYDQKLLALRQARDQGIAAQNAQKGDVQNAYTANINKLNEEKTSTLPKFQQQRDAAWVDASQNTNRLHEAMAQRGEFNGGPNITGEVGINTAKQNTVIAANTGQNQFLTSYNNRMSETNSQRSTALQKIADAIALSQTQEAQNEQGLNSWKANAITAENEKIAAENRAYQRQVSLARGGSSAKEPSLSQQKNDLENRAVSEMARRSYAFRLPLDMLAEFRRDYLERSNQPELYQALEAQIRKQYPNPLAVKADWKPSR